MQRRFALAVGWRLGADYLGRRIIHHSGVTDGARSVLLLYPDQGMAVAVLSNARWTASMEATAASFASVFLDLKGAKSVCPSHLKLYAGNFAQSGISGSLTLEETDGICRGSLNTRNNALGAWMKGHRGQDAGPLRLLISRSTAALVTPLGIYTGVIDKNFELDFALGARQLSLVLSQGYSTIGDLLQARVSPTH